MANLKLAVISDLHIGYGARSKDLSPHADSNTVDEKYLSKFIKFLQTQSIRADYLIIPGDITGKAHPEEFQLASEVILNIAKGLGVREENILFVPGNHDKNWSVMPPGGRDSTGVLEAQMYAPLKHDAWIFERALRRSPHYMLSDNGLGIWEFENLILVGYNSSRHDNSSASVHHGLVSQESLQWLDAELQSKNLTAGKVKIFLVHHHPVLYSDPFPDEPDFSAMTNAENLLNLLHKYNFDLLLHGHKHMPHFRTLIENSSFPLVVLGAGSFSSLLGMPYHGHVSNQFHLLEIDGRDEEEGCIYGLLRNWSYLSGHGWKASQKHDGILDQIGFGVYTSPPALKRDLLPKINSRLKTIDYVRWTDMVSQEQRLSHIHPDCVMRLLQEIASEIGVELMGNNPGDAILLAPRGEA